MILMREQDQTMDTISGTLSTLAQQTGLMGQEIVEHNECVSFASLRSSANRMGQDVRRP